MDAFQKALEELNELLNENGVVIKGSRYESPDRLGLVIGISGLDFSEHDKNFYLEIESLKTKIRELENKAEKQQEKIDCIKKLNDECCEENIKLKRENKELKKGDSINGFEISKNYLDSDFNRAEDVFHALIKEYNWSPMEAYELSKYMKIFCKTHGYSPIQTAGEAK